MRTIGRLREEAEERARERRRALALYLFEQRRASNPGPAWIRLLGIGLVMLALYAATRPWTLPRDTSSSVPVATDPLGPIDLHLVQDDDSLAFRWSWAGDPVAWSVAVFDSEMRELARVGPTAPGGTDLRLDAALHERLLGADADAGDGGLSWMVIEANAAADVAGGVIRRSAMVALEASIPRAAPSPR